MPERPTSDGAEPGLADLLRRLGDDASALVRGEVALAKLEMRASLRLVVRDSGKLAVAFTLAILGAIALTAALVIGVGHLLGGRFGFAALIVGIVFLVIGAVLARNGMRAFSDGELLPAATLDSIGKSRDWAKREVRELRRELSEPDVDAALEPSAAQRAIRERTLQP